jgi:RTX calcium-binding nonapeptide repeat (4 copies)
LPPDPPHQTRRSHYDDLWGGSGKDEIVGYSGADELGGYAGDDDLAGSNGVDVLAGGAGDDVLAGGGGSDMASYLDAPSSLDVDLAVTGSQSTTAPRVAWGCGARSSAARTSRWQAAGDA